MQVITTAYCHKLSKDDEGLASLDVQVHENALKLYDTKSKENVGMISSSTLFRLAREFKITFSSKREKLQMEKHERQTLGYKETPIQIVIYGLKEDVDAIGSILSNGGLFLQHPTHGDTSVPYKNPQFLLAPGTEMPNFEDSVTEPVSNATTLEQCLDNKGWASEVFRAFDTVDGPATFAPVQPSPRLQTKLQELVNNMRSNGVGNTDYYSDTNSKHLL